MEQNEDDCDLTSSLLLNVSGSIFHWHPGFSHPSLLASSCKHTCKCFCYSHVLNGLQHQSPGAPPKYYYVCLRATLSLTLSLPYTQSKDPKAASVKLLASQKNTSEHKPIFINIIFVCLQEGHIFDVPTKIRFLKSKSFFYTFLGLPVHNSSVQVIPE